MAQPTSNSLQVVDPVLTNMFLAYMQADSRFIANRVAPAVSVDFMSATYYYLTKKYWFMREAKKRAPGNPVNRGGYGVESTTLTTMQYALGHTIPRENRANNQTPLSLEKAGLQWLAQQQLINREIDFASVFMASSWGTNNSSATKWSDYAASDPVSAVKTAKRTISQATGFKPNQMVMGEIVDDKLSNHPDILDRLSGSITKTAATVEAAMAAIFGVNEYIVSEAIYDSANESQTAVMVPIIDDDCLVVYTNPGADMMTASGGKTFYWQPGGGLGVIEPMWFDNFTKSDVIDSFQQFVHKITASDAGYFFSDIVD